MTKLSKTARGHCLIHPLHTYSMASRAAQAAGQLVGPQKRAYLHDPALEDSSWPGRAPRGCDALEQKSQLAQAVPPQQVHTEALSHQDEPAQVLHLPHDSPEYQMHRWG